MRRLRRTRRRRQCECVRFRRSSCCWCWRGEHAQHRSFVDAIAIGTCNDDVIVNELVALVIIVVVVAVDVIVDIVVVVLVVVLVVVVVVAAAVVVVAVVVSHVFALAAVKARNVATQRRRLQIDHAAAGHRARKLLAFVFLRAK